MPTNVRTDNRDFVTQYAAGTVVQPADPVLLKPKGDPGVALHFNSSATINNAAGTVFDHSTKVAHSGSFLGAGAHVSVVIIGQNVPIKDGDNGFLSWSKDVFIEGRKAVMDAVDTGVNSLWSLLPEEIKNVVRNGEAVALGMTADHFVNAAKEDAQAMLDALMSKDTLIALAQTAAMMGLTAIPVVGTLAGGAATAMRIKSAVEAVGGAAEELNEIVNEWSQPMSEAQLEAARKKLASWLLKVGISAILAALGKALPKLSKRSTGKENSTKPIQVGTGPSARPTGCACSIGKPVIIATGEKKLTDTDFELPGDLSLIWTRQYRSGDVREGWFGQGWSHPLGVELALGAAHHHYHDASGRRVELPALAVGAEHFDAYEQLTLRRPDANTWHLDAKDGTTQIFTRAREDLWLLPLAALQDRNGNRLSLKYRSPPDEPFTPWRPEAITDAAGRLVQLAWDDSAHLASITLQSPPRGSPAPPLASGDRPLTLARYTYSAEGDLESFTDAVGARRSYAWQNHVMVGYTRADGGRFAAQYDVYGSTGRVTRSWNEDSGEGLTFEYDERRRRTRVTDAIGRVTTFDYDERRDIIATTGPDGVLRASPFDSNGNPRGTTDALGRETHYQFDARGNLTTLIDAAGARTAIEYNLLDLPVKLTDALDHVWLSEYDPRGNLTAVVDPLGQRTSYRLDERGRPLAVTGADGGVKHLEWDEAGNLIGYTDASSQHTAFAYDLLGRLISRVDALGQTTVYARDGAGRLASVQQPDGATHHYRWDGEGRLLAYTNALGHTTSYASDALGRPTVRKDAAGRTLRYDYDAVGRLTALINENGAATRFGYDVVDNLIDEIGFDGRHQRYVYNAADELIQLIEVGSDSGHGKVTHFSRDVMGRLASKTAEGDDPCNALYRYDALGRLTAAENQAAKVSFTYDPVGQLLVENQTLAGASTRVLAHRYDAVGNRIATTLPDGRVLHWLLNGSGHMRRLSLEEGGQHRVIVDIERDALHREVIRSQGPLESRYEHDPMGRLTRHRVVGASAPGAGREPAFAIERGYRYDASGNLEEQLDALRGAMRYDYDPTARILASHPAQGTEGELFSFDPAGNLLDASAAARPGGGIQDNRLEVFQDLRYTYDAHGNVVERKKGAHEAAQLTWSADHQLASATVSRHGVTQTTRYEYDALGRRTRKSDAFGSTVYLWDGDLMVQSQRGIRSSLFLFEPNGFVPLATIQDSEIYWYQCDQIGAPRELTAQDGSIAWAADYRVWGEATLRKTGTDGRATVLDRSRPSSAPRPIEQPFRFQGQQFDEETGLHYNRFRYYDPGIGRFVSLDPIGLRGGHELYSYAPNPFAWIDPSGLTKVPRLNIKKPTYENPGHHDPSQPDKLRKTARTSVLPCHHEALASNAVPANNSVPDAEKTWYAVDDKGVIHQFQSANGKMHWAGDSVQNGGIRVDPYAKKRLDEIVKQGKAVKTGC